MKQLVFDMLSIFSGVLSSYYRPTHVMPHCAPERVLPFLDGIWSSDRIVPLAMYCHCRKYAVIKDDDDDGDELFVEYIVDNSLYIKTTVACFV